MKKQSESMHGLFTTARSIIAGEYDGKSHASKPRPLSMIDVAEASAMGALAAYEAIEKFR
jgi:hypothetical protein